VSTMHMPHTLAHTLTNSAHFAPKQSAYFKKICTINWYI